jgi:hypothetical protein
MSRAPVIRAVLALAIAAASVALAVSKAGFPAIAASIGVRVGVPGAGVELARAVIPLIVALLVAALSICFGIRALRKKVTLRDDIASGGRLLTATVWAAWVWLVVELCYRELWLGWATLFGNVGASLVWSTAVLALCLVADRLVPWEQAPRGVRHLGLLVVLAVGVLTAWSAWCHRDLVSRLVLIPVAVVGLLLLLSGVRRVESGPRERVLAELGLASLLLAGPFWRLFS